jgi:hypothetical protein
MPVTLSGTGTDKEDGTLADSKLSWHIVLVHADHAHDFITVGGRSASFTPATDHDADSYYRVTLTATDSKGLASSKTVTIVPQTVNLDISSVPPGAPLTYAGYPQTAAPYVTRAAVGFLTTVSAAERVSVNGRQFVFASWSDGGAISHDITIPAQDVALVARYRDTGPAPFAGGATVLGPAGDKLGPVIRLRSRRPVRRLTGTVSDPAGVSSLRIAVRRGCRWWNVRAGRLGRAAKCAKPRWMKPALRPVKPGTWAWTLKLGGPLPPGTYRVLARAVDAVGNVSSAQPRLRRR